MDSDKECLRTSFLKTRAKNNVESNILDKTIRQIDKQYKAQVVRADKAITEERRFAWKLKKQSKKYEHECDVDEVILRRMDNIKNNGLYAINPRTRQQRSNGGGGDSRAESEDMSINGQKCPPDDYSHPKMYFWSQDASTKMPVMSGFYGYRMSLQRSLTEAKLLGQHVYPEIVKREVQSADPMVMRGGSHSALAIHKELRRIHTSGAQRALSEEVMDVTPTPRRVPPPTRENTFFPSETLTKTPERSFSSQDLSKQKLPKLETPVNTPEYTINVTTRNDDQIENLLSLRTAGLATRGNLRSPRKPKAVIELKTRGEATREYQELIIHKQLQDKNRSKACTELERSYSNVPTIMEEVNRLKAATDHDQKKKGQQYAKSTFNQNMQDAISKKVLNKTGLPVAFRKNNNTFLKHYKAPIMEIKAVKLHPVAPQVST